MNLSRKRLEQIVNNLCDWACKYDEEFKECFIQAAGLTYEEALDLNLLEDVEPEPAEVDAWAQDELFYELLEENNEG